MINKTLLVSALTDKFNNLTLHSIVNECFINGLPLDTNETTKQEKIGLTRYSYDVLKKIGGFKALESAICNKGLSMREKLMLGSIYNICTEASCGAAKRVASETDCNNTKEKFSDIVDRASFTEDEYKKFTKKAENLKLEEISDIIKEKTLAVIKDEQEQYEKEEKLDSELKDALSESKDFTDTSVESYMDIVLQKSDPRHHISLFSKLQDSAMEMLQITKLPSEGCDVIPGVIKVTFEGFLDELKMDSESVNTACESYCNISNEELCNSSDEMKPKLATLISIVVYTIMETLKTLNIYSPSMNSVKKFVNGNVNSENINKCNENIVYEKARSLITESNTSDFSKMKSNILTKKLANLKEASESIQLAGVEHGRVSESVELVSALESQIEEITEVLSVRDEDNKKVATEGYFDNYNRSHDISQMNKIGSLFGHNPNVSEIRLKVNEGNLQSVIDVECANESHQIIKKSFINLQYACESDHFIDYIKDTYKASKLSSMDKNVCIIVNDGKGQKIAL